MDSIFVVTENVDLKGDDGRLLIQRVIYTVRAMVVSSSKHTVRVHKNLSVLYHQA